MRIKLAYGKTGLGVVLPDGLNIDIAEPTFVEAKADQAGALRDALQKPVASKPLKALVKPADKVAIVFNDITRPTPYHIILPVLLNELNDVPDNQVVLINATGTHRANTEAELREMLGDQIVEKYRVIQNDAKDDKSHLSVGKTNCGNDIKILREYLECDVKILTGFIEPHFFAGFSGGGKAVMPGLAHLDTVLQNHGPNNIDHPKASWGITEGNPIWEDIREAALITSPTFLLNVTLNRDKQITNVFAGDFEKAHAKGCAFVKKHAMIPVKQKYDIVITSNSGHPSDLNLYQSVKGMSAASEIVKNGGSIIIAADCWDGIPNHGKFGKLLLDADNPKSLLETIRCPGFSEQDTWQAQIQALICQKADVYFYSRNLTDEQIKAALLNPCHNIEETVSVLLEKYGKRASICVLPEGPQTIAYISDDDCYRQLPNSVDSTRGTQKTRPE